MAYPTKKIGLLDHLGAGNLGDDATLTAVIQNIGRRWSATEFVALSMNPADTIERHGISAFPIRRDTWVGTPVRGDTGFPAQAARPARQHTLSKKLKLLLQRFGVLLAVLRLIKWAIIQAPLELFREAGFLARSFKIVRSLDVLVISGGGQLLDRSGGPWGFPYTIWKWLLLARICSVRRLVLNVGAGPLRHPLSIFFVRRSLRAADYVSFRDANSETLTKRIGFRGESQVVADNVYSLEVPKCYTNSRGSANGSVVGLSPMAYCDPRFYYRKDQRLYSGFIDKMAVFAAGLIDRGFRVVLFSSDIVFDRQAILELKQSIRARIQAPSNNCVTDEPVNTTEEIFARISSMDYVVTCRFHGVVFAHLLKKPVLAVSHHDKVASLMKDIGLTDYCIDIDRFEPAAALDKFELLVKHASSITARMADKLVHYRAELGRQFDRLFPAPSC